MGNCKLGITFIYYPESAVDNWISVLGELGKPYAFILHDKDCKPSGELKKPHWHVVVFGTVAKKQIDWLQSALHIAYYEDVRSRRKIFEYLTHSNNPDKYQYPTEDIVLSEGFTDDIIDFEVESQVQWTADECRQYIVDYIERNDIIEYWDLNAMLLHDDSVPKEVKKYVSSNYGVKGIVDSRRHSLSRMFAIDAKRTIERETQFRNECEGYCGVTISTDSDFQNVPRTSDFG